MREGAHSKPMDVKLNQSVMLKLSKLEANRGQIEGLPKNPRIIKDEKFKKLVKSIEENPEMTSLREILVYPHNGKYVAIGGNMRLKAMKELGYKEAPCKIIPEETTLEQLKAYTYENVSSSDKSSNKYLRIYIGTDANGRAVYENVLADELDTAHYAMRWYVFKKENDGWHVDGRLVKKKGQIVVDKVFGREDR